MNSYVRANAHENNSVAYQRCDGKIFVHSGGTRAWRNNNPGNIRNGDFATRHGAIGAAGGFAVFPSYEIGFAALIALLRTPVYQGLTLGQAIHRYAPAIENDTNGYIKSIERQTGVTRLAPMSQLCEIQIATLAKAIERHEGYKPGEIKHE